MQLTQQQHQQQQAIAAATATATPPGFLQQQQQQQQTGLNGQINSATAQQHSTLDRRHSSSIIITHGQNGTAA